MFENPLTGQSKTFCILTTTNSFKSISGRIVCDHTTVRFFRFAGQGTAEPCSAMDAEQGSAVP